MKFKHRLFHVAGLASMFVMTLDLAVISFFLYAAGSGVASLVTCALASFGTFYAFITMINWIYGTDNKIVGVN